MNTAARKPGARSTPLQPRELEPINQESREVMTWQQQKEFPHISKLHKSHRRRPQKDTLRNEAKDKAQMVVKDGENSASVQQVEPPSKPKRRGRPSWAQGTTSLSLEHTASSALVNDPVPNQAKVNHPTESTGSSHNKATCGQKKEQEKTNMTVLRKEAYVPPHLRNRTSATKPELNPVCTAVHQATPPSPATTPCESAEHGDTPVIISECTYAGWDVPTAKTLPAVQKSGNPRWPRGPQPYKRQPWPKNKDMKYVPSSSCSDGGVACWSNSNGDPDYDVKKLLDWNGDWLPAPESWSARRGHDNRHLGDQVEQWINGHAPECVGSMYYPPATFSPGQGVCKELAPRYWLEAKVEGTNLRESWKVISTSYPKALDDCDLTDYPPWWELYEDVVYTEVIHGGSEDQKYLQHPSCYLNPLPVPDASVDPTDPENCAAPHNLASAKDKILAIKRHREEKQRRMLARRNRPVPSPTPPIIPMEDRRLRPQANIYIRPVQPADVVGIAMIYNYYVENTIHATEFDGRTEAQMRQRINTITSAGLPYLVAISKSNPLRDSPGYTNERIVGYINLDDYCSQASLFRYTFEMELFVHPGYTCKGIGKCLMDRLLEMADTSYRARGGYEYVNNYDYLKTGPARVIKTILLNVHHENGEDAENGWQGQFLRACKFYRVGRLPKVGYKCDKVVDVAVYAHHTKEEINASVRPTVAG